LTVCGIEACSVGAALESPSEESYTDHLGREGGREGEDSRLLPYKAIINIDVSKGLIRVTHPVHVSKGLIRVTHPIDVSKYYRHEEDVEDLRNAPKNSPNHSL